MLGSMRRRCRRLAAREEGAVSVEFAILCTVFLMLVFGVIDMGHAWYMKQIVTNASREGARYGTRYQTDASGNHILPSGLSPSIGSWIQSNYASMLPADANLSTTVSGPGYTTGAPGQSVNVSVSARKTWFLIGRLIPGLGSSINLTSATVMSCE